MARFAIKAIIVTALVCLVFDLAASDENLQQHGQDVLQHTVGHATADKDAPETATSSSSFKDKFKGFVASVKEGASETLDTLNEKRKEAYAGTKKIVNGVIDKVKSFNKGSSEEDEPRAPASSSSEEHVKDAANKAKDAVVDKTQNFMKSEKLN
ncbi:uncharacterized protein LOC132942438 isoform X1 [Metopolophium dirhodum]|uniref:uncharacterized protein LOC132942438 isoform X1 n=1 Tax=Metopolophium dirhodum TaxID=44670 RepID=UPI00298FF4B8|nr:uncharacterized protein LOC132942438 isoform X1 [Metopolophium dirhodum]